MKPTAMHLLVFQAMLTHVTAQGSEIVFSVDMGEGLIYFLIILFFGFVFATPILRWIYVMYVSVLVEKAGKEMTKASRRFHERMSDVSRNVSQSVRVEKR
jgi:hypothetical protein